MGNWSVLYYAGLDLNGWVFAPFLGAPPLHSSAGPGNQGERRIDNRWLSVLPGGPLGLRVINRAKPIAVRLRPIGLRPSGYRRRSAV